MKVYPVSPSRRRIIGCDADPVVYGKACQPIGSTLLCSLDQIRSDQIRQRWCAMRFTALAGKGLGLVICVALFAGCATGPRIFVNEDPAASFSSYKTFSFEPQLGTDRPGYSSILSQYLRVAVSRELEARGYRQVSEGSDLAVNFYLHTAEKVRTMQSVSGGGGYYGYRRGFYGAYAGYPTVETEVLQYTEGRAYPRRGA